MFDTVGTGQRTHRLSCRRWPCLLAIALLMAAPAHAIRIAFDAPEYTVAPNSSFDVQVLLDADPATVGAQGLADFENRLTEVAVPGGPVVAYEYDPFGTMISRTVNGQTTNYLIDGSGSHTQILEEYDDAGNVLTNYTYGLDLISQTTGGQTQYFHQDGQLNTRLLTDTTGVVTDTYVYDAFGTQIDRTGTSTNLFTYGGEYGDPDTSLIYLRARHLDPSIGRFTTMDTFAGIDLDPITLNKYLYANSDPTSFADPSGHIPGLLFGLQLVNAIIAIAGATTALAGAGIVLEEFANRWPDSSFSGVGVGGSISGTIGAFGSFSVGAVASAQLNLITDGGFDPKLIFGVGYSIGASVSIDTKSLAAASLGIFSLGVSKDAAVGIDFNNPTPGDAVTTSLQIGPAFSGGITLEFASNGNFTGPAAIRKGITISGSKAFDIAGGYFGVGLIASLYALHQAIQLFDDTFEISLSTSYDHTTDIWNIFCPIMSMIYLDGTVDWSRLPDAINHIISAFTPFGTPNSVSQCT